LQLIRNLKQLKKAPIIGISRFRIGTDGKGITSLVCFHGCPMRCKYCLNPHCTNPSSLYHTLSSHELLEHLTKDELYYIATGGGVTFGGGEPLLYSLFIEEVLQLGASRWNINVETSLNVPLLNVTRLFNYNVHFIVDVKDMNPSIYMNYTSSTNVQVTNNLAWIADNGLTDKVSVRLPLIHNYNTVENQNQSRGKLEAMGFNDIEMFTYITNIIEYKNGRKRTMQYSPSCAI
jgi:pyruvate formate lyase activating enzyme